MSAASGTARRLAGGRRHAAIVAAVVLGAALAAGCASATGAPRPAPSTPPSNPASASSQVSARKPCAVTALLVPTCGAWWGMYLPVDPGGGGLDKAVSAEDASLGRPLDIVERYHDMSLTPNGVFPNRAERRLAGHHLLLFSWAPNIWQDHASYRWSVVASGALDASVIIPEAKRLRAFKHTVFLSFGAEPDGEVPQEGTPAQFVAAWRHIHDVFARLGVTNVVWVWTTEGYLPHARVIAATYPGSAYVDWIGYDPYNFYTCHHTAWRSFAQTVRPFYAWLAAHQLTSKPIMIAEYGSAQNPGNPQLEAAWYGNILPVIRQFPDIKALVMWNASIPTCDLRLPRHGVVAAAYRQTGLAPYFRQKLP